MKRLASASTTHRAHAPTGEPSSTPSRARRGIALLITLVVVVLLAILSTGAVVGSMTEFRGGRNALVEQRAFAVAEFGLNAEIADWDRSRNLPPPTGMAIGAIDSSNVFVAQDDTAKVYIQRLTDNTFAVRSVGRASIGNGQLESQRQTQMIVRIAYPSINPGGAIVTAGVLDVRGSPTIDGRNNNPAGWAQCASIPGRDTFAISHAPASPPKISGSSDRKIFNGINPDPAAADSNTYVRYGTETWNSLVANANIRVTGSGYQPLPTVVDGECEYSNLNNAGEPFRTVGHAAPCVDYFPIVYATGSLTINGNRRGQGILLVNGDLTITGTLDWFGLIIVRDDVKAGAGTARVMGSLMARNAVIDDGSMVAGTADFYWSKCAVESALRGSAILTRTRERSWAQMY